MKKIVLSIVAVLLALVIGLGCGYYFFSYRPEKNRVDITVSKAMFDPDTARIPGYVKDEEAGRRSLETIYGFTTEEIDAFYENAPKWLAYLLTVEIKNDSEDSITVLGFQSKDNGKDGVYFATDFGGELSISAGGKGEAIIPVLCSNGELSDDAVKALVDGMDLNVLYSKTPTENDDGSQSAEETKTVAVDTTLAGY
ncbi:MAG: hypothetical protein IK080_02835 [Clostridia bacterium]|nr:hypothetical protein [Clostridia bacterium]